VIRGWEIGLARMSLGERATLNVPSLCGYGSNGAGAGKIPPNSALCFDVQLLEINGCATTEQLADRSVQQEQANFDSFLPAEQKNAGSTSPARKKTTSKKKKKAGKK
jgi:hypothetical protein